MSDLLVWGGVILFFEFVDWGLLVVDWLVVFFSPDNRLRKSAFKILSHLKVLMISIRGRNRIQVGILRLVYFQVIGFCHE